MDNNGSYDRKFIFLLIIFSGNIISYHYYKGESKVLQYFSAMKHNLVNPDAFAEVMKMINHTGLREAELTLLILSADYLLNLPP